MKRSESDGTDLSISKKTGSNKIITLFALVFFVSNSSWATKLHLYSVPNKQSLNGVLVSGSQSFPVTAINNNGIIEGLVEGTSSNILNSINDGTGGETDSVNDGTGGQTDSINDGTGGSNTNNGFSLDGLSVSSVFTMDMLQCNEFVIESTNGNSSIELSDITIDNEGIICN